MFELPGSLICVPHACALSSHRSKHPLIRVAGSTTPCRFGRQVRRIFVANSSRASSGRNPIGRAAPSGHVKAAPET